MFYVDFLKISKKYRAESIRPLYHYLFSGVFEKKYKFLAINH